MATFRIKELIKAKGFTLESFAEYVNIPQGNISNIANGNANPTVKTLEKIAEGLNVELPDLYVRKEPVITCPNCGAVYEMKKK